MLTAGLGLKLENLDEALAAPDPGPWFEVYSGNYMMDGWPRLAAREAVRREHLVSYHGVGLSLASAVPPNPGHVARLARLARIEPCTLSDHIAWTRWGGVEHGDFLPFLRSRQTPSCVVDNIQRVQDMLRPAADRKPVHLYGPAGP
jgi:uncharacterized protein (UPF0276 family)